MRLVIGFALGLVTAAAAGTEVTWGNISYSGRSGDLDGRFVDIEFGRFQISVRKANKGTAAA